MVWDCMAASGFFNLHFIEVIMNSEVYKEILSIQLIPSVAKLHGHCYILQLRHAYCKASESLSCPEEGESA